MSFFTSKPALRWSAPLAVLVVVGASGLVVATATADNKLPERTAEQLLVDLQQAKVDGLSGTVVQRADLGIPSIPGAGGGDSSQLTSLISGSHTLRVWYSGPDKARIAVMGTLGESDIVADGSDLWTWSSQDNKATHRRLQAGQHADQAAPTDAPKTPQEAAQRVLSQVGPTTEVSTASDVTVADRAAYELVLKPKDARSKVSEVTVAVDGETHLPLRVQVLSGDTVAFEVGYQSVTFGPQDASRFTFNPPPAATVTEVAPKTHQAPTAAQQAEAKKRAEAAKADSTVVGTGWTSVVVSKLPAGYADNAQVAEFVKRLPETSGSWGKGRLLDGTVFSAVLTDDGRIAVGAVQPALLDEALAK
ncbi:MAG: hypothetical protein JWP61_982 [Friedmanniella sp.]|nr:hypothetical protein [Friedmanniella sp.]